MRNKSFGCVGACSLFCCLGEDFYIALSSFGFREFQNMVNKWSPTRLTNLLWFWAFSRHSLQITDAKKTSEVSDVLSKYCLFLWFGKNLYCFLENAHYTSEYNRTNLCRLFFRCYRKCLLFRYLLDHDYSLEKSKSFCIFLKTANSSTKSH